MKNCPHCGRKLLSHISANCNWCGAEIEDPGYQAQAEVERAALEAEQARHDRQTLDFGGIVDSLGLLTGLSRPVLEKRVVPGAWELQHVAVKAAVPVSQIEPAPEAPAAPPVSETQGRFDHLEL